MFHKYCLLSIISEDKYYNTQHRSPQTSSKTTWLRVPGTPLASPRPRLCARPAVRVSSSENCLMVSFLYCQIHILTPHTSSGQSFKFRRLSDGKLFILSNSYSNSPYIQRPEFQVQKTVWWWVLYIVKSIYSKV